MKSLKQWYLNYINLFREEHKKLSKEEKKFIGKHNNFLPPCQIEIFWIADIDWQLIAHSNFNDRQDKEIIINGPYKLHEFYSKVAPALENKKWDRGIRKNLPEKYEQFDKLWEKMAMEIREFVMMSEKSAYMSLDNEFNTLVNRLVEDVHIMVNTGNIGKLEYSEEVDRIIQDVKQKAREE